MLRIFNCIHAQLSSYRRGNWAAMMRGMRDQNAASDFWGSEQYNTQNWYGRYQSYGVCEIHYPGSNGYGGDGWDWRKPPGATTVLINWTDFENARTDEHNGGGRNFTGGLAFRGQGNLAGGQAGITAFNLHDPFGWTHGIKLRAYKTEFCFGNYILRLGSDLSDLNSWESIYPVATTLFQRRLQSTGTPVTLDGASVTDFPYNSTTSTTDAHWLVDNYGTGFFVPPGNAPLVVSKSLQSTPKNGKDPADTANYGTGNVAAAWLDHGPAPSGGGYEYLVAPGTTAAEMAALATTCSNPATTPYTVLQKNASAHVARWNPDATIGYAIFAAGSMPSNVAAAGALRSVNKPCLVMTRPAPNGNFWLSLNNPNIGGGGNSPSTFAVTLAGQWALMNPPASAVVTTQSPFATSLAVTVNRGLPVDLELQGSTAVPATLVAAADAGTTTDGTAVTVDVVANDLDATNLALSVSSVTAPANGTATVSGTRTVTYTPVSGFTGTDTFSYTLENSQGATASATVTVTVLPANDLNASLLAWYQFDDTSGTIARDSSGRGNHGTLVNGPVWSPGKVAGALSFDGSNDFVSLPVAAYSGVGSAISISFWAYGDAAKLPANTRAIYGTDTSGNTTLEVRLPWGDSKVYWHAGNNGGNWNGMSRATTSASQYEGQWNHWVFTKNVATSNMSIYLNGTLWTSVSGATYPFPSALGSLRIGGNGNYYPGLLDDVRIYGRALTTTSVQQLGASTPPSITSHPASLNVNQGQSAAFSVTASGASLSYQWRRNGVPISGATGASFTIAAATLDDAASYSVAVTSGGSTIVSSAATLGVTQPPEITMQPVNQSTPWTGTAIFSVDVTGTPLFTFQWMKGGTPIPGATSRMLTISKVSDADAGSYSVSVSNVAGAVTSQPAVLTVPDAAPIITSQPASRTILMNGTATFSVAAIGTTPMTFQWRKDGENIPGATGSSHTINSAVPGDAGTYSTVLTNVAGTTVSADAVLTVSPPVMF